MDIRKKAMLKPKLELIKPTALNQKRGLRISALRGIIKELRGFGVRKMIMHVLTVRRKRVMRRGLTPKLLINLTAGPFVPHINVAPRANNIPCIA
mgnify:CR=1 FL=1|jgi:hypothetical protein